MEGLAAIAMLFFVSLTVSYSFPLVATVIACFAALYTVARWKSIPFFLSYLKSLRLSVRLLLFAYLFLLLSFFVQATGYFVADPIVRSAVIRAFCFNVYALIFFLEIGKENIELFLSRFARFTAVGISFVALISLFRMYLCFTGYIVPVEGALSEWQSFLSSLVSDYNFYALGILSGIFSVLYLWANGHSFSRIGLSLMVICLYFTASRRAVLVGLLLMLYLILASGFVRNGGFSPWRFAKVLLSFGFLVFSWLYVPPFLQLNFSPESKKNFVESFGLDYGYVSRYLPLARFRYLTLIDQNTSLYAFTDQFYKGKDTFFSIDGSLFSKDTFFSIDGSLFSFEDLEFEDTSGVSSFDPSNGGRFERWTFSLEQFEGYSLREKLFGAGGAYHFKFGEKFTGLESETVLDYPHNPVLSVLLYSGVLGVLAYLFVFSSSLAFLSNPSMLTIGLFGTAHFFNAVSLDLIWSNYHYPFMILFAVKALEVYGVKLCRRPA